MEDFHVDDGIADLDTSLLNADPLPWLLEDDTPAVKHRALRELLHLPEDDKDVKRARSAAMRADPIAAILGAQDDEGYWVKPGAGYVPKYTGTVWQVIFLDQLGADPRDRRVEKACEYVLSHTRAKNGGFGAFGGAGHREPPPSAVIHCLNGNLLRALIGFGYLDDERVRGAIEWQSLSITGEGFDGYYLSGTSGPGFRCAANEKLPCAWGAVKAMGALARIPPRKRTAAVRQAIASGTDFLLSRNPASADYPMAYGNTKPNGSWFRFGFPSGYVTDVLQNLEVLCELGVARDERLQPAIELMLSKQDAKGRWLNRYAYKGKTWVDFEKQGKPSKWVTLRACRVLDAATG